MGVCFEEDLPAQQPKKKKDLWVLNQDEHKGRRKCIEQKEEKGQKKACRIVVLSHRARLEKPARQ